MYSSRSFRPLHDQWVDGNRYVDCELAMRRLLLAQANVDSVLGDIFRAVVAATQARRPRGLLGDQVPIATSRKFKHHQIKCSLELA